MKTERIAPQSLSYEEHAAILRRMGAKLDAALAAPGQPCPRPARNTVFAGAMSGAVIATAITYFRQLAGIPS